MAREAGFDVEGDDIDEAAGIYLDRVEGYGGDPADQTKELMRFAALLAEECVKLCNAQHNAFADNYHGHGVEDCKRAIAEKFKP